MRHDPAGPEPHQITGLLREAAAGRRAALDELMPLVYGELSAMASARLRREAPGHTLETAGLVHEAWLRLVGQHATSWQDRQHFFAVASEAMRRILVDHAKRRHAAKRGDAPLHLPIEAADRAAAGAVLPGGDEELLALDEALDRLATFNAAGARVVQYRFFAGLSNGEVADLLGTSERTVRRSWTTARAWLRRELTGGREG